MLNKKELPKGLNQSIIKEISKIKDEPKWMLDFRLDSYKNFSKLSNPCWGPDLSDLDFQDIRYYASEGSNVKNWDDVPEDIKKTFERLGISQQEREMLAGLSTQYESEVIFSQLKERWSSLGIIFENMDVALKKYPKLFKQYFSKLIPNRDNKYAALNSAVWSGGSFVYIPKNVKLEIPIQTYFRINTENMGQFERTLIIAEEGSEIHYIEGCTAPQYMTNSLHAAVVEIYVSKDAKVRYSTLQNWSKNVYNLVNKRAQVEQNGTMEWVDCNIGSKVTMKYPSCILKGDKSKGAMYSLSFAKDSQHIDSGGKMIHLGKDTKSFIYSKTISKNRGKGVYRGESSISKKAKNSQAFVNCEGLILDDKSKSYSYPLNSINNTTSIIEHEAKISKLSEEKLKYLMSRGLSEHQASQLVVSGFVEPIIKDLPMEYTVELEGIIDLFIK